MGSRARGGKQREGRRFLGAEGDFAMPRRIDIDPKHSRAIIRVIGQQLRASLKPEPEQPESLRAQIERLRELEERSPSIVPADEHGGKRGHSRLMQSPKKYLELAEHYRSAKLDTKDRTAHYLLETLEHSYRVLAQSTVVLRRSRKTQKTLAKFHK
jgi:hypothetical protein